MPQATAAPPRASSGATGVPVLASITRVWRDAYDRVVGGVQHQLESWEDRVHEARAERTRSFANESLTVDDVLAGLGQASISSDIPGRLRLRLDMLRRQDELAARTADALSAKPGVTHAEVNPLTGSVLIGYDTERYPSADKLLMSIRMGELAHRRRKKRTEPA